MAINLRQLSAALQAQNAASQTDPYLRTIENQKQRLQAVGVEPAPPEERPSVLQRLLDVLDAPGRAVQTVLFGEDRGAGEVEALLSGLGLGQSPIANTVGNFLLRTITDPLTYLSFGTGGLATNAVRNLVREAGERAVREAGERVSQEVTSSGFRRLVDVENRLNTARQLGEEAAQRQARQIQLRATVPFTDRSVNLAGIPAQTIGQVTAPVREAVNRVLPESVQQGFQRAGDTTRALFQRFPVTERNPVIQLGVRRALDVIRETAQGRQLAITQAGRTAEDLFGRLSPEQSEAAVDLARGFAQTADEARAGGQAGARATFLPGAVDEETVQAAQSLRKLMDDIFVFDQSGIQDYKKMANYVTLLFPKEERRKANAWLTDHFQKIFGEDAIDISRMSASEFRDIRNRRLQAATSEKLQNARERFFRTFEDAERAGFHPIKDARQIAQVRVLNSINAANNGKMIDTLQNMAQRFPGLVTRSAQEAVDKGYQKLDEIIPALGDEFYWHPDIKRAITRLDNVFTNIDELNGLLQTSAKITNIWRRGVLLTPGFVLTQVTGNVTNSVIKGIPLAQLPGLIRRGREILNIDPNDPFQIPGVSQARKVEGTVKILGKEFPRQQLRDEIVQYGIDPRFTDNAFEYDFARPALQQGQRGTVARLFNLPLDMAREIDASFRTAIYMYNRAKGMAPKEAAEDAFKYIFNTRDISPTEEFIRSTAVPFYTFTRKQLPLLFKAIATHPQVYTIPNHIKESFQVAFDISDEEIPEYAEQVGSIPFRVGENVGFVNPRLSTEILSTEASPVGAIRDLLAMLNPAIRTPLELAANQQFFSGTPIRSREFQTQPLLGEFGNVPPEINHILRSLIPQFGNVSEFTGSAARAAGFERPEGESPLPEFDRTAIANFIRSIPGFRSFYNEASPERQRAIENMLYARLLTDQVSSLRRDQGIDVPTINELRRGS